MPNTNSKKSTSSKIKQSEITIASVELEQYLKAYEKHFSGKDLSNEKISVGDFIKLQKYIYCYFYYYLSQYLSTLNFLHEKLDVKLNKLTSFLSPNTTSIPTILHKRTLYNYLKDEVEFNIPATDEIFKIFLTALGLIKETTIDLRIKNIADLIDIPSNSLSGINDILANTNFNNKFNVNNNNYNNASAQQNTLSIMSRLNADTAVNNKQNNILVSTTSANKRKIKEKTTLLRTQPLTSFNNNQENIPPNSNKRPINSSKQKNDPKKIKLGSNAPEKASLTSIFSSALSTSVAQQNPGNNIGSNLAANILVSFRKAPTIS